MTNLLLFFQQNLTTLLLAICFINVIICHPAIDSFENGDDMEDPFLDNPRYKYSFNIVDDEEQTYQDQSQQMEDRVTQWFSN
jgi:hypothetical protein